MTRRIEILTHEQKKGIIYALSCASKLQKLHPEIVIDYRAGLTQKEIAIKYDFRGLFGATNLGTAIAIARYALGGNQDEELGQVLSGLMSKEEYELVSKSHSGGRRMYEKGIGLFAKPLEEIVKYAHAGGQRTYELRAGVHSQTHEQLSALGKKAKDEHLGVFALSHEEKIASGKKGVITRGFIPWATEEIGEAIALSKKEEYRYKGNTYNEKIAMELNRRMHQGKQVRNARAVKNILRRTKVK